MNQSKSNLVSSAEQILGYHFCKPSLLVHALTHDSYSNGTISYERLEFIGDAALNLAMANYLNVTYPKLKLGDISMLRSANVCNETLARVAVRRNIYPLVQINSPNLDKQVKKFIEAVKQKSEDEICTKKAPKVLADVVEAIAAAIYQDCNNLDMMWEVVKRLLEPLITAECLRAYRQKEKKKITAETFKQPVTALYQLCQKNRKVVLFKSSQEGKKTIFEVLIDGEKVGYGSSKNKYIAKLNAAKDALKKLNGKKSNLLIKPHKEVEDKEAKQKLFKADVLRQSELLTTAFRHSPLSSDAESSHRFAPIKMDKDSILRVSTIPHSQDRLVAFGSLSPISISSLHEKIETREKKEYHSVELRPTGDEKDKIDKVRKKIAAKQKLKELCMRHCPPPEYHETKGMSAEEEKGKREGHMADPPQHQHPKPALSPGLTASAQPAPESEEPTKYEELEESTEYEESEEDIPYMDKVDSYQRKTEELEESTELEELEESTKLEELEESTKYKELEESTESKESQESEESIESEEDIPYMDKVDSYQRKTELEELEELEESTELEELEESTELEELEESTEYEELEESTKYKESQELEESEEYEESEESEESEEDIPYMDKVDSYQRKTGYNVTVEEGRERRERRVPCCQIDIGWLLFILGFFLCGIPWCIGAIMLSFSRVDYREKPGYISCTIAAVLATIAGCIINNWSDKRS